ncbi:MAG: hypothetical protein JSR60_11400 [Proteobacteria bacterium]|nr:hypothetical protein [Pseudomonadota bacterium]
MKKRLLAVAIGLGAGLVMAAAYGALLYYGIALRPEWIIGGTASLVFAGAVAVFSLVAMDRPAFRPVRAALVLNEDPAKEFVFYFRAPEMLQITAKPEMAVGEMLVRFGDAFKAPPDKMTKAIALTIRGGVKKPFATITLQQLFALLKPFNLEHVLLMNDKDEFVGYIPGKRALKEFTGDKAMDAIDKYIVKLLMNPQESAILRELGGATAEDTFDETGYAMDAQARIWANEKLTGLILHSKLKPVGYISKLDLLRINAGLLN